MLYSFRFPRIFPADYPANDKNSRTNWLGCCENCLPRNIVCTMHNERVFVSPTSARRCIVPEMLNDMFLVTLNKFKCDVIAGMGRLPVKSFNIYEGHIISLINTFGWICMLLNYDYKTLEQKAVRMRYKHRTVFRASIQIFLWHFNYITQINNNKYTIPYFCSVFILFVILFLLLNMNSIKLSPFSSAGVFKKGIRYWLNDRNVESIKLHWCGLPKICVYGQGVRKKLSERNDFWVDVEIFSHYYSHCWNHFWHMILLLFRPAGKGGGSRKPKHFHKYKIFFQLYKAHKNKTKNT